MLGLDCEVKLSLCSVLQYLFNVQYSNTAFTLDVRFSAAWSGYQYRAHQIPVRTHFPVSKRGAIDL